MQAAFLIDIYRVTLSLTEISENVVLTTMYIFQKDLKLYIMCHHPNIKKAVMPSSQI